MSLIVDAAYQKTTLTRYGVKGSSVTAYQRTLRESLALMRQQSYFVRWVLMCLGLVLYGAAHYDSLFNICRRYLLIEELCW